MDKFVPQHGMTKIQISLDTHNQRLFCKFVIGSERLPPGGLSALKSPITVAMKDGDDGIFPTVSTYVYYFMIPS